jgi:signal transduction histidine kinase
MLKKLRWRLSALYLLAAAALVALIGGGAYGLLSYYFKSSTDLALQYKVALEFSRAGQSIPDDLQAVDRNWQTSRGPSLSSPTSIPSGEGQEDSREDEGHPASALGEETEEYYDSELASIFLLIINSQGQVISSSNTLLLNFQPDQESIQSALANGSDFRTVRQADGSRMRLFTYRVSEENGMAVLQVGRSLQDQDRVLNQLLIGLGVLGGLSMLLVGAGSWWLAGRSLNPAQRAWDRQQTFVANASHELRAPLTLLRASAEVVRRGISSQDPHYSLLGDILGETDHMSSLVEDLLLLSRLDAGQLELKVQPVALAELLEDLGREMGRVAAESGVAVKVIRSEGRALADPTRLRQVLLILLDNALNHTPAGGSVRLEASETGRTVRLQVSDTGRGITAQHMPHLFERFYRGEADRSQESHGSGLGLAIARGLVEAMQGQINLSSQPGLGTRVTIQLPAAEE